MREKNNLGFLRLIFASFVIVGHAPEQIDGNRGREPLTLVFHTISLGGLSVAAFFLLSGFLISKSALASGSVWTFLTNRVRRIWPGYIVAFCLCAFVLAPILGGSSPHHPISVLPTILGLGEPPTSPGLLSGLSFPKLNGSMWTLRYEFRCYLLIALLLVSGILHRRWVVLTMTAVALTTTVLLAAGLAPQVDAITRGLWWITGTPSLGTPLTATFLVGTCIFLFWPELRAAIDGRAAIVSTVLATVCLFFMPIASVGLALFGGVALIWVAMRADLGGLQRINDRWDISYGTYLYGWPVAIAILYFNRSIGPSMLAALTLPAAMALGALSWWGVEKPAKDWLSSALRAADAKPKPAKAA